MRTLCDAIALALAATLAAALALSAPALARARHHHAATLPRVAPLPPERPDITSMFDVIRRGRPVGPDGLAERAAK